MTSAQARVGYQDFTREAADVYGGLSSIGKAVIASGLPAELVELLNLRVSQINGCAFCIQHHLSEARRLGVPAVKLDLVAAWRDAEIFSDHEMAALAWCEALTKLSPGRPADAEWQAVNKHFSEIGAIFLTAAIGTINNWNRIAIALRFSPRIVA